MWEKLGFKQASEVLRRDLSRLGVKDDPSVDMIVEYFKTPARTLPDLDTATLWFEHLYLHGSTSICRVACLDIILTMITKEFPFRNCVNNCRRSPSYPQKIQALRLPSHHVSNTSPRKSVSSRQLTRRSTIVKSFFHSSISVRMGIVS